MGGMKKAVEVTQSKFNTDDQIETRQVKELMRYSEARVIHNLMGGYYDSQKSDLLCSQYQARAC